MTLLSRFAPAFNSDRRWADVRTALLRLLWPATGTIPAQTPTVTNLGSNMPAGIGDGQAWALGDGSPSLYRQDSTADLDHVERWVFRVAHDAAYTSAGVVEEHWPDWFTQTLRPGQFVDVFVFVPRSARDAFLLLHDGHGPWFVPGHKPLIAMALSHGMTVAVTIMPPTYHPTFGQGRENVLGAHAISHWLEPSAYAFGHALELGFTRLAMEGFSGGGWTAHLYAAADPRIERSYAVAGALPFDLRTQPADVGDWEQLIARPIYALANYDDWFAMSASDGRHVTQVLNEFDTGAFAASGRETAIALYARLADERATGSFQSLIDLGETVHDVHQGAIDAIEADLLASGMLSAVSGRVVSTSSRPSFATNITRARPV